jgi:heat shock protein HslJ
MNRVNGLIAAIAMASVIAGPLAVSAQQAAAQQAATAQGELVSVDVSAKTLVIKPTSGQNMTFSFNDDTKISGANSPAGLATMGGSQATVKYTTKDKVQTATEIQITAKK